MAQSWKGVDWSSTILQESQGRSWKSSNGQTQPLETILKDAGVNTVRQRIWVNPSGGTYNLDYNIRLGKRAKAAGLAIYLDFHYADDWADPGKQPTPAAWRNYNIDDLTWKIYNYTKEVMDGFQSNGLALPIVSIGNEIRNGLLWPLGKLDQNPYNTARLLHSASAAIKDSTISPKPRIMLHIDNGWDWGLQQWWYDTVLKQGPLVASDYDIQGVSYYPFYNEKATLASLQSSLRQMKSKYNKAIQVVETNWPTSCSNPSRPFPADVKNIPFSVEGQRQWMQKVAAATSAAGGEGLFYWEPAWIDNAGLGSSCGWNLMVDNQGRDMGSLNVFQQI
ncbi:glycoside hydrolase family 53 protein [Patellaria atrata CBS 101060]|uniref:Arabinogalactan endo-beta-1,4-galactanase n=1 Tax=Patellaria atrata CBS 101060 TaxID=1346257 RepID=A0A9P4SCW1_9PEZI|nr:glycoside hydrolase family 53 protein [Patellaria atrata CBS 101060]